MARSTMLGSPAIRRSRVPKAAGVGLGLTGSALVAVGLWGRREARLGLARERVVGPGDTPVTGPGTARALADFVRETTVQATGGRTYAEVEPYVDAGGSPTPDAELAAKDERTGQLLENPDHDLWIQATTLQTALLQAYMAFRLAEATIAIGGAFVVAGIGLVAAGRDGR